LCSCCLYDNPFEQIRRGTRHRRSRRHLWNSAKRSA
jgi:hypothetical protein